MDAATFKNRRRMSAWLLGLSALGRLASAQSAPPEPAARVAPAQYAPADGPTAAQYFQSFSAAQSGPPSYAELLPDDRGWAYESDPRLLLRLQDVLEQTWIRIEYLQGNIQRDGGRALGAPLASTPNPNNQFTVTFTDGTTTALAQVPSTSTVNWSSAQGIRGSFGIPITDSMWIEGRAWSLGQSGRIALPNAIPLDTSLGVNDTLGANGYVNSSFMATTLLTNGQPGTRVILYDTSFTSLYKCDTWTGDVNILFNWKTPQEGLRLQPLLGYRHEEYGEQLSFGGSFSNLPVAFTSTTTPQVGYITTAGQFTTPVSNNFDSRVRNFRDMFQFGLRNEWVHSWLTIGATEKMAFGPNLVRDELAVQNVRDPGSSPTIADPALTITHDKQIGVGATFDLDVYARIKVNELLNFRIGYSLIWMGNLGVADQSIYFNEKSNGTGGTDANVVAAIGSRNRIMGLFTIGGEIVLP